MNKHLVNAFTIMEITVTMLISAIVIGITYSAYLIISQSYILYHKKSDDLAVLIRLDELLKKDFVHADSICTTPNGIILKKNMDSVIYNFRPDLIIRTSTIIDTFKIKSQDINMLFENKPVSEISPLAAQNRIDEMGLTILFQEEKIPYHYYKKYSSSDLIERKANAVN